MAVGRKKGAPKTGGRQKGTPNKATVAKALEIASTGLTPLDYMVSVYRDARQKLEIRLDAAKAAAPYVHPRLATMELSGKDGGPIEIKRIQRIIIDPEDPELRAA